VKELQQQSELWENGNRLRFPRRHGRRFFHSSSSAEPHSTWPAHPIWYEAYADLDGERIKLQVFSMRSMASGAAFHRAYPCATQQAFLEAHELAFAYFEGVFRVLRYDNLSSEIPKTNPYSGRS
jgi:transposase